MSTIPMPLHRKRLSLMVCTFFVSPMAVADDVERQRYDEAQRLMDFFPGVQEAYEKTAQLIDDMWEADPDSALAHVAFSRLARKLAYHSFGRYDPDRLATSEKHIQRALEIDSSLFDAYFYGTYTYLAEKKHDQAKKMVAAAQRMAPESPRVALLLAEIALAENDDQRAIRRAESIMTGKKDRKLLIDTLYCLTTAYRNTGRHDLVRQCYETIIQLHPESPDPSVNFAQYLTSQKDYDGAIELARKALKIAEFPMGHRVLATALYEKGVDLRWNKNELDSAKKCFAEVIEHNPKLANAYYCFGDCCYRIGHRDHSVKELVAAIEAFEQAIKLAPDHKRAKDELASVRKLYKRVNR